MIDALLGERITCRKFKRFCFSLRIVQSARASVLIGCRSLIAGSLLLVWLLLAPYAVSAAGLEAILANANPLATLPVKALEKTLESVKPLRDQATPAQQLQIELLELRSLIIKGEYDAAKELVNQLEQSALTPDYRIRTYGLASLIYTRRGDYGTGFEYLTKALELLPWTDRSNLRYIVLANASEIFAYAGDIEKSRHYADRALRWADETGDPRNMCTIWAHLGYLGEKEGDLASARLAYQTELDICRKTGDQLFQGHAKNGLGQVSLKLGEYQEALRWHREAVDDMQASGFADGLSYARLGVAKALYALGDLAGALDYLEIMIPAALASGKMTDLQDGYLLQSKIAESKGDHKAALAYYRQHAETREKVTGEKRLIRLAGLQVEFDTAYKEQQINLLEQKNQLLELQERTDKQRRWFYLFGLLAITLICGLLLLLLRKTYKERFYFKNLSREDGLTGLYNHFRTYELAERAFDECRQQQKAFTVIVADVDSFKQINDTYGHAAGDEVLKYLAGLFRGVFVENGIVGRTAGEEFTVFLPGTTAEGARELIEQYRQQLAPVVAYTSTINVSLCFGFSQAEAEQLLLGSIVREADEALYHAKSRGRDKIVEYRELLSVETDYVNDA